MIEQLSIRDLGVIAAAEVELGPGLIVLTGETGAGKTMFVTALDLLFGAKTNPSAIRAGVERAVVEASIAMPADGDVIDRLVEIDADLDDDTLIISRTIGRSRSRATAGGRGVPAAFLTEVGDALVVRHGQNDQRRLGSATFRRTLLDRYAGSELAEPLARYQEIFDRHQAVVAKLNSLSNRDRDMAARLEFLRFGQAEIEAAGPTVGEDEELLEEQRRLDNVVQLRQLAEQSHHALRDADDSAEAALAAALASLEGALRADPAVQPWVESLQQAQALIADTASELASYASSLEADPQRLEVVHQRLADLAALRRKYGDTLADVLAWAAAASAELIDADTSEDRLAALRAEQRELADQLRAAATEVTAVRHRAADRLSERATAEVQALAMPHAKVLAMVAPRTSSDGQAEYRRSGADLVDILLQPHTGAPAVPIGAGASGGEASRVMLGLEVTLAAANPVPVFVFDEVDAGIGGRAAVEVGKRLAALAQNAQVIVVTHLPQVAAFADQHIVVRKEADGQVTASSVVRLSRAEQQRELARMLAGLDESASANAHAAELIDLAAANRQFVKGNHA